MVFQLSELSSTGIEEFARHYDEQGFCVLTGVEEAVTNHFDGVLADVLELGNGEFQELLDPRSAARVFPQEVRRKLARVPTTQALTERIIAGLRPALLRLLGPMAHISSSFHAQFKGGSAAPVDHGGYIADLNYMEVHGAYLLHQDFTGASLPTSPSALTVWVGLNECPDWKLRLYPGSHRLGLLCDRWLKLDDQRLQSVGKAIELQAKRGTAVIFNSLLLHGTGDSGPLKRVSCDIRFFPVCGFLPTPAHLLVENPRHFLEHTLSTETAETLRAPLLEDMAWAGAGITEHRVLEHAAEHSILNWPNYLTTLLQGDPIGAVRHLERFANTKLGVDAAETYISKFHGYAIQEERVLRIRELLASECLTVTGESSR